MFLWYQHPLDKRACAHGEMGVDGKQYRGGEFLPFYIPRAVMPQIDEADFDAFFAFIESKGVSFTSETFSPKELRAHQRVSMDKAKHMDEATLAKPVLVSRDHYVLDGNHRWTAHVLNGTDVPAYQIDLDFEASIELMFAFPKTYSYGDGQNHPITR